MPLIISSARQGESVTFESSARQGKTAALEAPRITRLAPVLALLLAVCAMAALGSLLAKPAYAAPSLQEGKAYSASISWSNAKGRAFASLLHNQAVVLRQGSVYWVGLASTDEASDKKITKLIYGTAGDVAETEATEDNTRVFMFPVSSIDQAVQVGVQQSGASGTARLTIDTSTLQKVPVDATWRRLAGKNALDTMAEVVKAGFAKSDYAILATNAGYWDALSASGLAGIYQCPIVLTAASSLSTQAADQLDRMGAKNVIIVGGTAAVSSSVEKRVAALGYKVERLGGKNAVETSYRIWQHGKGQWGSDVITATKDGYWDAISIAPYAYRHKAPVLLHNNYAFQAAWQASENHAMLTEAAEGGKRVVIAGGSGAVSVEVEALFAGSVRLAGKNAYDTSSKVAQWCVAQGMNVDYLGLATGSGYWDALVAGPFCGKNNAVLLLADDAHLSNISGFVLSHADDIEHGYVFGGSGAVGNVTFEMAQLATSTAVAPRTATTAI